MYCNFCLCVYMCVCVCVYVCVCVWTCGCVRTVTVSLLSGVVTITGSVTIAQTWRTVHQVLNPRSILLILIMYLLFNVLRRCCRILMEMQWCECNNNILNSVINKSTCFYFVVDVTLQFHTSFLCSREVSLAWVHVFGQDVHWSTEALWRPPRLSGWFRWAQLSTGTK